MKLRGMRSDWLMRRSMFKILELRKKIVKVEDQNLLESKRNEVVEVFHKVLLRIRKEIEVKPDLGRSLEIV
jgi:hypothetical protein